jgi:hypothetical protein
MFLVGSKITKKMKKYIDYNVIKLGNKELLSVSGGDSITQGFFSWLGRVI